MSGRDNRGAGGGGGGGHHHQPLSSAMGKLKEKLTRAGVSMLETMELKYRLSNIQRVEEKE